MYSCTQNKPAATSAGEEAAADYNIPDDLILVILYKLPVNSLLRFCSVSKQWNDIITSSIFKKNYINYLTQGISTTSSAKTSTLIYSYTPSDHVSRFLASRILPGAAPKTYKIKDHGLGDINDYFGNKRWLVHLSSCSGLLCMARVPNVELSHVTITCMRVCNPATGKYRDVPRVPAEFGQILTQSTILGFGYDPTIDDYKIVYSFESWMRIVLVMSLKTNTWRSVDTSSSVDISKVLVIRPWENNTLAACSGALYWIVHVSTPSDGTDDLMILKFDLDEERFELLPFPNEEDNKNIFNMRMVDSTLSSYKGSLYYFIPQRPSGLSTTKKIRIGLEIWMLERRVDGKTNNQIWRKVGIIPRFKGIMLYPLGFNCSGHVIMKSRPSPYRGFLFLYAYLRNENKFVDLCETKSDSCEHLVQMESLATP